ncbi:uncharacterized protein MONBRDRAFT_39256 [Monosiga brevicollis MX1]|uniref:Uncharacterized protein n=1 Tax=Monosiga brevicollis TaxID=81824 RepID=A9VDA0_MONBE|nr:uncharacterized protein MONBRDRAFT_39256 [Monosiga brevicollis MX1]EDQ84492.1 predicted protein [Monosiga brevicollis MX1]|eukprot:XP_001750679.1 hypothetical protein [Monosiga brevicollis MX1]
MARATYLSRRPWVPLLLLLLIWVQLLCFGPVSAVPVKTAQAQQTLGRLLAAAQAQADPNAPPAAGVGVGAGVGAGAGAAGGGGGGGGVESLFKSVSEPFAAARGQIKAFTATSEVRGCWVSILGVIVARSAVPPPFGSQGCHRYSQIAPRLPPSSPPSPPPPPLEQLLPPPPFYPPPRPRPTGMPRCKLPGTPPEDPTYNLPLCPPPSPFSTAAPFPTTTTAATAVPTASITNPRRSSATAATIITTTTTTMAPPAHVTSSPPADASHHHTLNVTHNPGTAPPPPSSLPSWALPVAICTGASILILLVIIAILLVRRRRRRHIAYSYADLNEATEELLDVKTQGYPGVAAPAISYNGTLASFDPFRPTLFSPSSPSSWAHSTVMTNQNPGPADIKACMFDADPADLAGVLSQANSKGDLLEEQDEFGFTLLSWAIRLERADLIPTFLELGANPAVIDTKHQTLLHLAAEQGNDQACARALSALLAAVASYPDIVNAYNDQGYTCLMQVAALNMPISARVLLAQPACNLRLGDPRGQTALHLAILHSSRDVLHEFRLAQPQHPLWTDCTATGATPLHLLATHNCTDELEWLLSTGAVRFNSEDGQGRTWLHCAVLEGHLQLMQHVLATLHVNQQMLIMMHAARDGTRPIDLATHLHATDVVEWLESHSARLSSSLAPNMLAPRKLSSHAMDEEEDQGTGYSDGCGNSPDSFRADSSEDESRRGASRTASLLLAAGSASDDHAQVTASTAASSRTSSSNLSLQSAESLNKRPSRSRAAYMRDRRQRAKKSEDAMESRVAALRSEEMALRAALAELQRDKEALLNSSQDNTEA